MNKIFFLSVLVVILMTSCVSQKKYDALEADKMSLQQEVAKLKKIQKDCEKTQAELTALQEQFEKLSGERDDLKQQYANLENANEDLMSRYDKLLDQNTTILSSTSEEKKVLSEELAQKKMQLDKKESELAKLESELQAKREELDLLRTSLEDREARIATLEGQLDAQRNILSDLKTNLTQALLGFSDSDLTVTQKDGKVYVSMSQNLLFAKGSTVIDVKGKDAIQKVSSVLAQNKDIDILVEGHTDTDGTAERNWDLSVSRATAVVKLMTSNGVDPKQLTAAGRAFYEPVAPNDNEANKSKNRRTEIILAPRLDELFKLLEES